MAYQQIFTALSQGFTLTKEEKQFIKNSFCIGTARTKDIILEAHIPCDNIYFVNKGLIRAYYTNDRGEPVTRMIASENRFLTNILSFQTLRRSPETFICLEDTEYLSISKKKLCSLLDCSQALNTRYREILEEYNAAHINHIHSVVHADAPAKIRYFRTDFAHLVGRISDEIIGSFLGLSRETVVRHKKLLF